MCYNSHYVPQFILRNFGIKINIFDCLSRSINCQEEIQQSYVSYGLYPDDVERLLCEKIETPVAPIIGRILSGNAVLTYADEQTLRKFIFVGFLRSLRPELISSDKDRSDLLRQALSSESFPAKLESCNRELLAKANTIQDFLYKSRVTIKKREIGDSFIVSDVGPVFNNIRIPTFASFVISPDAALFFHLIDLVDEGAVYSNMLTLEQCSRYVTYRSINELSDTFSDLQVAKPELNRYVCLMNEVLKHNGIVSDPVELSIEQMKTLSKLETPYRMRQLLEKTWCEGEISNLIALEEYEKLSALIIFNRFGVMHIPTLDRWHYCFRNVSDDPLFDNVRKFSDNARCEFDKCIAALYSEMLAERGYPEAAEKMGRLYRTGKHVPVNEDLSRTYYEMAACKGNCDAISQLVKKACEEGDEKRALWLLSLPETPYGGHYMTVAEYRECNGNIDGAIEMYTEAAKLRYVGAFSKLFKHLIRRREIEKVEELVPIALSVKSSALNYLLENYNQEASTDCSALNKVFNLINEMESHGMKGASELRAKYGYAPEPAVSKEELDALNHLKEMSELYCKLLDNNPVANGPLSEAKACLEKILRKVQATA